MCAGMRFWLSAHALHRLRNAAHRSPHPAPSTRMRTHPPSVAQCGSRFATPCSIYAHANTPSIGCAMRRTARHTLLHLRACEHTLHRLRNAAHGSPHLAPSTRMRTHPPSVAQCGSRLATPCSIYAHAKTPSIGCANAAHGSPHPAPFARMRTHPPGTTSDGMKVITKVSEGGLAVGKLVVGDVIVSANGQALENMPHTDALALIVSTASVSLQVCGQPFYL
jgi:hypothetical protein